MQNPMQIPAGAEKIINALENAGYKAYLVGGCVRDHLLGKSVSDTDITTSARPNEVESVLAKLNIKVAETGIQHGTVTAVLDKTPYEITTFRSDGEYKDSRHPQNVEFLADIEGDLKRRDFTVNAMAYNEQDGLIDLFGGRQDLQNKLIRAVGDADARFKEDALRIMRALRFSSTLGFAIEERTKKAVFDHMQLLNNISPERIFSELLKLLCGDNVLNVLAEYRQVIGVIIPRMKPCFDCAQHNPWHCYDVYGHIIHAVAAAPKDPVIRLTMLLHDIGKPLVKRTDEKGLDHFKTHAEVGAGIAAEVLASFKASNEISNKVTTLVKYHQAFENVYDIRIKRWLGKIGPEYTLSLFDVRMADLAAHNPKKEEVKYEALRLKALKQEAHQIIARGEPYRVTDLAVNGNDLIKLGYSGKEIGETLNKLLSLVIDGALQNTREELMRFIQNNRI